MSGPVVASFALNSTGLGHASRLVAVHDALRRDHGAASVFFTEHRITLIDEYGFEQVVLPPHEGSLLGDTWWNRDEGTASTAANSPALARTILAEVLGGRTAVVLHDVVLHEQLYLLARERGWRQAFIHRPRADVTEPAEWLAGRAPGVATMYLVGAWESSRHGRVDALAVPDVRRRLIGEKSVWGESDTGVRITVSAGGGGHADAATFVHAAVDAVTEFAATSGRAVSALVVPGPFYGDQVRVPSGSPARFRVRSYLPPTHAPHRDTDVQICQGGYNTVQELAQDGVPAVVVPGKRMIDDQARRARELAATAPNIRVAECDPAAIAAKITELTSAEARPTERPPERPARNGADALAPTEWWLDKHPMAGWVSGVAERSGIDREQVARVMEAAIASGIQFELPEAEAGFHITRYVMYQRIAQFFRGQRRDGRVLEVSGGAGAIAGMFAPDTTEYLTTTYPDVDVQDLSYPDSSFDYVVCDQVIEHIPEPQRAVDEIQRVLRPGGWLILATCFMDPVHTHPDNTADYWRFTPAGLRHLVRGYSAVYQCEGWGNREALNVVLFGGLQKYVPVSGHPHLEGLLAKNELDVPLSTWAIAQR